MRKLLLACLPGNGLALVLIMAMMISAAAAQVRNLPADVKTGELTMGVFPQATIDGSEVRFGAGARILNADNRSIVPVSLSAPVRIAYQLDFQGLVKLAWIITDAEAQALAQRNR